MDCFVASLLAMTAEAPSIRDLVSRRLHDRLPERGVGGELFRQAFGRRADRDQADRGELFLHLRLGQPGGPPPRSASSQIPAMPPPAATCRTSRPPPDRRRSPLASELRART